jgi:hypothetical protein
MNLEGGVEFEECASYAGTLLDIPWRKAWCTCVHLVLKCIVIYSDHIAQQCISYVSNWPCESLYAVLQVIRWVQSSGDNHKGHLMVSKALISQWWMMHLSMVTPKPWRRAISQSGLSILHDLSSLPFCLCVLWADINCIGGLYLHFMYINTGEVWNQNYMLHPKSLAHVYTLKNSVAEQMSGNCPVSSTFALSWTENR